MLAAGALLLPSLAVAQVPADVPLPPLDTAPAPALPAPTPTPAPAPAPAPPPAPAPLSGDLITAQVGTRVAVRIQNPNQGSRDDLDDVGSDGEVDVLFWGQLHRFLKWQAGFVGSYGTAVANATGSGVDFASTANVLDLVARLEIADAFNLWIGRMPIPVDRASLSTAWALSTWTLPGTYSNYPQTSSAGPRPWPGPRYGDRGRSDGVTFWGQLGGGRFKYYAGAYDLDKPNASPLFAARVGLSLMSPEPGYRNSNGYYGEKNILAIGIGGQHQEGGSRPPSDSVLPASDFNELGGDLLLELNGGAAGVLDVEGGFAKMWGDHELGSYQIFGLASYLVPIDIGIGRVQPLVRCQHSGAGKAEDAGDFTSIDAQLGYIVDGFHTRLLAVYQYARLHGRTENAILLGLQLLSHAK